MKRRNVCYSSDNGREKRSMVFLPGIVLLCLVLLSCSKEPDTGKPHISRINLLNDVNAFGPDSTANAVIEIPAGTNQKWEVNKNTGEIEWERVSPDSCRVIRYLPYPVNYGFIPQTLVSQELGGDGDPLDVLVLGESLERETILPVRIIGAFQLLDMGERDPKLIAIPIHSVFSSIQTLAELESNFPGLIDILKIWLKHYKGKQSIEILSVENEQYALDYLKESNTSFILTNKPKN